MLGTEVRPGATLRVVSGPIPFRPEVEFQAGESFLADLFWSDYECRIGYYVAANSFVFLFPPTAAEVREGRRYVLGDVVGQVRFDLGLVEVEFRPAGD